MGDTWMHLREYLSCDHVGCCDSSPNRHAMKAGRRDLFTAEREAVISLRDAGEINAEVMRRVERDIDLEELRFSG